VAYYFRLSGGGPFSVHQVLLSSIFFNSFLFAGFVLRSFTITVNSVFHRPINRILSLGMTPCFSFTRFVSSKSLYQDTTVYSDGALPGPNVFRFLTFLLSQVLTFFHNGPGSCLQRVRISLTARSAMSSWSVRLDSTHSSLKGHKISSSSRDYTAQSWVMNTTSSHSSSESSSASTPDSPSIGDFGQSSLSLLWDSESLAWTVDLGILPVKLNKMRIEHDSLIYNCLLYCDLETSLMSVNNFAIRLNTPGNVKYIVQGRWGKTSSMFASQMCNILWLCLESHKGNKIISRSQYLDNPTPPLLFMPSLSPELNWSPDPQNHRRESHSNQMVKSWNRWHGIPSNRSHQWLSMMWTLSQLQRWNIGPRYETRCWLEHSLIYRF